MKTIYLAGGCFWGMQKFFDQFDGVAETEVGYANGPDFAPSYQEVCKNSGHAETLRIEYDPEIKAVWTAQEEKAGAKLAVELEPIRNFFSAEEYHQKYLEKNPGGYCHIPRSFFSLGQKG